MDHKLNEGMYNFTITIVDKDAQVAHVTVLLLLFLGEQAAILLYILSVP